MAFSGADYGSSCCSSSNSWTSTACIFNPFNGSLEELDANMQHVDLEYYIQLNISII